MMIALPIPPGGDCQTLSGATRVAARNREVVNIANSELFSVTPLEGNCQKYP